MQSISIAVGRAGAGKTAFLARRAESLSASGEQVLFIVPEQATFEMERTLAEHNGAGLYNIEVCSFTSLARKVLAETGERRIYLSRQGKLMLLRRCIAECAPSLSIFARVYQRAGFAVSCEQFFTECKRAAITPEKLLFAAETLPETLPLKQKIAELAQIYMRAEAALQYLGMDDSDALLALCERFKDSKFADRHIIIDGFDLITEQLYAAVNALMLNCKSFSAAVRLDLDANANDHQVFSAQAKIYGRLCELAEKAGRAVEIHKLSNENDTSRAPSLRHLERNGLAFMRERFEGSTNGTISLYAASSIIKEAEAAADEVLKLVQNGFRYREIAIIAAQLEPYVVPVSRALKARGIPFFTDAKHSLLSFPATRVLSAAMRCAARLFRQADLLELVKTGFAEVDDSDAEVFESYVIEYGIEGRKLLEPFKKGNVPPEAERVRQIIVPPISKLRESLLEAEDAKGKTEALYNYLQDINLSQQLENLCETLYLEGRLELMEENAQVYSHILDVLSQLFAIFGAQKVSTSRYIDVLNEGFSAYEVGTIPKGIDQVLFGSLGRTRARNVRALLVVGAEQGAFPATVRDEAMVDDSERDILNLNGLTELQKTSELVDKERADVYGALTRPSEYFRLSYTMGGSKALPCELFDACREIFDDVKIESDLNFSASPSPKTGFEALVSNLRQSVDEGVIAERTAALYNSFIGQKQYKERLELSTEALFHQANAEPFGKELARQLYGVGRESSATRLETFNACGFKHFARYGLRIEAEREYKERRIDEGIFCHQALLKLTETFILRELSPKSVTNELIDSLLDEILPELIANHNGGILLETARGRAASSFLVRKIKQTAHAMVAQLALGKFRIFGAEIEFGNGKALPPIRLQLADGSVFYLSGKIDRVDKHLAEDGSEALRVIDYKTGSGKFDYASLYYGLKLQLPLYLTAITATGRVGAAGMYYMQVKSPELSDETIEKIDAIAQNDAGERAEMIRHALMEEFKLQGLSLLNPEIIEASGGKSVINAAPAFALAKNQLGRVMSFACDKAKATADKIMQGEAPLSPVFISNYKQCEICDYNAVCMFDEKFVGCKYKRISTLKADDFFSLMDEGRGEDTPNTGNGGEGDA